MAFAFAFLAVRYREQLVLGAAITAATRSSRSVNGKLELGALAVFVVGLSAFTWHVRADTMALGALLELFLLNLLWWSLRPRAHERAERRRSLATAMFALAFGISAGVDVVTLSNDIVRMNTVFKFGLQAWQFFALGSAFATWYVGRALWQTRGWRLRARPTARSSRSRTTAIVAVLFLGSSIFLVSGTRSRQDTRFASTSPTLNGLAFTQNAVYSEDLGQQDPAKDVTIALKDDMPLIDWLRVERAGQPRHRRRRSGRCTTGRAGSRSTRGCPR